MDKQRIDIDRSKQRNDHGVMATEALAGEATHVRTGERSGIPMVVAIHSTYLGRSLGGCRMWRYGELEDAVRDAERLSHAMTLKAAAAGLPLGGGKSVIALPQGESLEGERRHAALRDFADLLNEIDGRYVTAEDVGVSEADMAFLSRHTAFVVGRPAELGGSGDPSPFTAMGVEIAIRTALGGELAGRAITVAGLGNVGGSLAQRLARAGARLTVTDIDPTRRALADRLGAAWVEPGEAIAVPGDVFAPCALGAVLDEQSVERLQVPVVAGAANNQLAHDGIARLLHDRGILWAPDFIANAGGLINVAAELDGYDRERVIRDVEAIGPTLRTVFARARAENTTTLDAAHALVAERLAARR
jgi:leucine dehydrogenase